ncbi:hypothetical protein GGX14DRAFT_555604 [Mycena pura]|uniref:Uncharacterized protein n=1 Tax=Mycena pura TaxID=153505 RepID=A0AAD6YR31_9AGAR|nr:hypothetical protein GGX14DRAFT_555604 [Mycena pura]
MCAALAASAPPAARCTPAHGRHACSGASYPALQAPILMSTNSCGQRMPTSARRTRSGAHTRKGVGTYVCAAYAALCRSLYACASARRARSAVLRTLMLTPVLYAWRGSRCAATRRRTSFTAGRMRAVDSSVTSGRALRCYPLPPACLAAAHACTGRCCGACAYSPHGRATRRRTRRTSYMCPARCAHWQVPYARRGLRCAATRRRTVRRGARMACSEARSGVFVSRYDNTLGSALYALARCRTSRKHFF